MGLAGHVFDTIRERWIMASDLHSKNFVLKCTQGQTHVPYGRVSRHFTRDCEKICGELKLRRAVVMGRYDGRMKLYFSHQIQKKDRQKFWNSWCANTQ